MVVSRTSDIPPKCQTFNNHPLLYADTSIRLRCACTKVVTSTLSSLSSACRQAGGHPGASQSRHCEECQAYTYFKLHIQGHPHDRHTEAMCMRLGCRLNRSRDDAIQISEVALQRVPVSETEGYDERPGLPFSLHCSSQVLRRGQLRQQSMSALRTEDGIRGGHPIYDLRWWRGA